MGKQEKELEFKDEEEFLIKYSREQEEKKHHDFYIFGHRHIVSEYALNEKSTYINLGDWVTLFTYGVFDGTTFQLRKFDKKS